MNGPKLNPLLIFSFNHKYLKYEIYLQFKKQNSCVYLVCNRITVLLECKTVKRNSQRKQGPPMEQARG